MKKTKNLIILLVVLAVAIVIYIAATIIANREEKNNETPEDTKITIIDKTASDVASVSLESSSSNYTIELSSSTYYLKDDHTFPLDQTKAQAILETVSSVECNRLVSETGGDSADYGLDKPLYTITAAYTDGAALTFKIGDYNRHTDSYYLSIEGEGKVYLIDKSFTSGFEYSMKDLLTDEKITEPDDGFGCVTAIEIAFSDGTAYKYTLIPATIAESGSEEEDTEESWRLTLADGKIIPGDFTEKANNIYDELFDFVPSDWVDYNVAEEEQLAKYGLSEPYATITVFYEDIVTISGEDGSSSTVTKPVEKNFSVKLGNILPDSGEADDAETSDSPDTTEDSGYNTEKNTSTADGSSSSANNNPEEETEIERYFLIGGGKIVYIASENDFEETLTFVASETEEE